MNTYQLGRWRADVKSIGGDPAEGLDDINAFLAAGTWTSANAFGWIYDAVAAGRSVAWAAKHLREGVEDVPCTAPAPCPLRAFHTREAARQAGAEGLP